MRSAFIDWICRLVVFVVGFGLGVHAVLLAAIGVYVHFGMANSVSIFDTPITDKSIPIVTLIIASLGFALMRVLALSGRR